MTWVRIYVAAYFLLVIAAFLVLWASGVIGNLPTVWTLVGLLLALGLGALLFLVSAGFRSGVKA